jgi:periplasmic glucans biosynthesis protein
MQVVITAVWLQTRRWSNLSLTLGVCFLVLIASSPAHSDKSFQYEDVVEEARLLAEKSFELPETLPKFLLELNYDQWRGIRFKPEDALWRGEGLFFEVQFFHPGGLYNLPVSINIVESADVKSIPFSRELFHYGMNEFQDQVPEGMGFAGFRLHYPINTIEYYDEVVVFLGASYFRAVGSNQQFGLSARGVAINTAMESGEEFPYFREFWLIRPQEKDENITIFALLDGPSLTGAYQFGIRPGKATLIDVTATLFLRKEVKKLGIAPLTSMFFYGENTNIRPVDDFRPEVHDSDGLQIVTATDGRIWRPLVNPKRLLVTWFQLDNPKAFGLFQRDRDFDHYQDLVADYHMRPSAWLTPDNDWGEGRVELVQIPTDSEFNDNIVAYWVPESPPQSGSPISFSYQMKWDSMEVGEPQLAHVVATRTASSEAEEGKMYIIDFKGGKLSSIPEDAKVEADIVASRGNVVEQRIEKNRVASGWRLFFKVIEEKRVLDRLVGDDKPFELRAFLRQGDEVLTETWSYVDPF